MGTRDPRIDAYIAKQRDFAKPILTHIRVVVHAACPDVEKTLKWSSPHFEYTRGMMCGMAAFNEHAIFGFWKGALIEGVSPNRNSGGEAMGEASVPGALAAALGENRRAAGHFEKFSPSQRREYIEWIDDAKRDDTQVKRIAQAIEWIADGKGRNWKYEKRSPSVT